MAKIDAFFNLMMEVGASDLHLASGSQPIVRVRGELERITHPVLVDDALGLPRPRPRHRELVEQAELHRLLLGSTARARATPLPA